MKISCHRVGFLQACQMVGTAVPTKDILPVLQNIKVVADGNGCTLIATDAEIGIRMSVNSVTVESSGEALLLASRVIPILRELQADEVTIETTGNGVSIRAGRSKFELPAEDANDFPSFPEFDLSCYHEVTVKDLSWLIDRTLFAVVKNPTEARWGATTGVLCEFLDDTVRFNATDGKRMAIVAAGGTCRNGHTTQDRMSPVSAKALTLVEKIIAKSSDDDLVLCSIGSNEAMFKTDQVEVYSRLIEGRFPDCSKIVPSNDYRATAKVGELLTAIKQAAIMTNEEYTAVAFCFEDNLLTLQAKGPTTGESRVELPIQCGNPPLDIKFNPKYFIDMLKVLDDEQTVTIELKDHKTPALLYVDGEEYQYVVVPIVDREKKDG